MSLSVGEESTRGKSKYYRAKRSRVEPEALIQEVRNRPELWNFHCKGYRNKEMKRESWEEICEKLVGVYKDLPSKEKEIIVRDMTSRWKGYRDAYIKTLRKSQLNGEMPKYIHADLLTFLSVTIRKSVSMTDYSIHDENTSLDPIEELNLEPAVTIKMEDLEWTNQSERKRSLDQSYESDNDSEPLQKRIHQESERHLNDVSFAVEDPLEAPKLPPGPAVISPPFVPTPEDDDMSFFKSIMPAVKDLNKYQKMSFRIQVMQVLQSFASNT